MTADDLATPEASTSIPDIELVSQNIMVSSREVTYSSNYGTSDLSSKTGIMLQLGAVYIISLDYLLLSPAFQHQS